MQGRHAPSDPALGNGRPPRCRAFVAGLLPLAFLGALAAAIAFLRAPPGWVAGLVLGAVLASCGGWVLVSVLWPARAERTCPACGALALERRERTSTVGRRCRACGFAEDEESAWLLAEDEGVPLEPLVLEERRNPRVDRSRLAD
jgi:predicted RNA-binding Zn-ribbon protein involved in translation (DUF1610 family)